MGTSESKPVQPALDPEPKIEPVIEEQPEAPVDPVIDVPDTQIIEEQIPEPIKQSPVRSSPKMTTEYVPVELNLLSRPRRSGAGRRLTSLHSDGDDVFWNQDFFHLQDSSDEWSDSDQSNANDDVEELSHDDENDHTVDDEPERGSRNKRKASQMETKSTKQSNKRARRSINQTNNDEEEADEDEEPTPRANNRSKQSTTQPTRRSSRVIVKAKADQAVSQPVRRSSRSASKAKSDASNESIDQDDDERKNSRKLAHSPFLHSSDRSNKQSNNQTINPTILIHSTQDGTTVSFSDESMIPSIFTDQSNNQSNSKSHSPHLPQLCVVTGEHAKYLHPITHQPYKSMVEYKLINEALARGESLGDQSNNQSNNQTPRHSGRRKSESRSARKGSKRARDDGQSTNEQSLNQEESPDEGFSALDQQEDGDDDVEEIVEARPTKKAKTRSTKTRK